MLIEFRVKNFRSYQDEQTFSMVAGAGKELPANKIKTPALGKQELLRSAVIYGANASGKSNLLRAANFVRRFVLSSAEDRQAGDPIQHEPFILDPVTEKQPSEFEVNFILEGIRFQYGFEVSRQRIEEEWLIAYPQNSPQRWFERRPGKADLAEVKFSSFFKGEKRRLAELTRPNALYLSVAAKWNHPQATRVFNWFKSAFRIVNRHTPNLNDYTASKCFRDNHFQDWVSRFLRGADLGIRQVITRPLGLHELDLSGDLPISVKEAFLSDIREGKVRETFTTRKRTKTGKEFYFPLVEESDGTQRLFELLGPWHDVLGKGHVLLVDELDSSMHPLMTRKLVESFHDSEVNRHGAQLVFTTHDTSLLTPALFRRDQVWFTERDKAGATKLYSLQDYHPRQDEALEKGYLAGRYGAVPFLGELQFQ
jgi:uncharacterized protein